MQQNEKTILVTGGLGYIASHVIKLLIEKKYNVISIDNTQNSHFKNTIDECTYFIGDFSDTALLTRINNIKKIDAVLHFAGSISVPESIKNPALYYENNTNKTKKLLTWMKQNNINNLIFSSTAAIFGESKDEIITEETLKKPINPYGISKLQCEEEIKKQNFHYVIFRYFNVAGASDDLTIGYNPTSKPSHIIPIISKAFLGEWEKLTLYGNDYNTPDKTAIRDYVHVLDIADAHLKALEYLFAGNESNEFNLGSEKGNSLLQIMKTFEKVTGTKIKYEFGPRREGDPSKLVSSYEKAKTYLNWKPQRSLKQIIESDYKWNEYLIKKEKNV